MAFSKSLIGSVYLSTLCDDITLWRSDVDAASISWPLRPGGLPVNAVIPVCFFGLFRIVLHSIKTGPFWCLEMMKFDVKRAENGRSRRVFVFLKYGNGLNI